MKILRAINGVPYEFRLTPAELCEAFAEQEMINQKENLLWALRNRADDEQTRAAIAYLELNPLFCERVTKRFAEFCSDELDGETEQAIAWTAYTDVLKTAAWEV